MKSYLLLITALYILASAITYNVLILLSVNNSMLIAVLSSIVAFFAHIYMEGIIITDDYEPKLTFKDHLSDFKYCVIAGVLVFIPAVFIGTGLSYFIDNSLVTGSILLLIGGL